jgi:hypothetical protein
MKLACMSLAAWLGMGAAADLDAPGVQVADKFALFKDAFNKSYGTEVAERGAFEAFAANEQIIVEHNRQGLSWWLGHNVFSDLTWDEFAALRYVGGIPAVDRPKNYDFSLGDKIVNDTSWDWTTKGAVTPVKDQGNCGSW